MPLVIGKIKTINDKGNLRRFLAVKFTRWLGGFMKTRTRILRHWSYCAVHDSPALIAGPCDCGVTDAERKWWLYLYQVLRILAHPAMIKLRLLLHWTFLQPSTVSILEPYQIRFPRIFGSTGRLHPLIVWLRRHRLLSRAQTRGIELPLTSLNRWQP